MTVKVNAPEAGSVAITTPPADCRPAMLTAGQTVQQIETWDDRIAAVTAEQVKAAANKYLTANHVDARLLPEGRW